MNGKCTDRAEVVEAKNVRERRKDGSWSNQMRVAPDIVEKYWKAGCRADYLGYMDNSGKGRFKYCRQTAWTMNHPEVLRGSWPLINRCDRQLWRFPAWQHGVLYDDGEQEALHDISPR